jgi:hypothetical protein
MRLNSKLISFLSTRKLFHFLLLANLCVSLGMFYYSFFNILKPDVFTYAALAKSLLHGQYSYWFDVLPDYVPDTLRSPGYPAFLAPFMLFPHGESVAKYGQLILYFISISMILKIISRFNNGFAPKNLFLLFLLPNIQLPFYTAQLLPESSVSFCLVAFLFIYLREKKNIFHFILFGLIWAYIYESRLPFLFLPFVFTAFVFFFRRKTENIRRWAVSLLVFICCILPYGFWNLANHKVFSITPLESGGGILLAGYWQYKLPDVKTPVYFYYEFPYEIISTTDRVKVHADSLRLIEEWNEIENSVTRLKTHADSANEQIMDSYFGLFIRTYSAEYTMAREKAIKEKTIAHIMSDFDFWLTRPYNLLHVYVTNVNWKLWNSGNFRQKIVAIYPTLVTGTFALLFIGVFIYLLFKNRKLFGQLAPFIILILYAWCMYFPFAAQSRYSISFHMLVLSVITIVITNNLKGTK